MKNKTWKNLKYWTKRFIFDTILHRYENVDIQISEEDKQFLTDYCIENEMSLSQVIEEIFIKYFKDKKLVDKVFGDKNYITKNQNVVKND